MIEAPKGRILWCRPPGARPTRILIGRGLAGALPELAAGRRVFALIDERAPIGPALPDARWTTLRLGGGEHLKTLARAEAVLRAMVDAGLDRKALLLAIGGGTVGDLGGLCAALFLRGIECWQVPTTLMGMVDSAVGGKTAVNLPEGKNLVGCVHPPALVAIDPDLAAGLPQREFDGGLAEALKTAIGLDQDLFELLEGRVAAVRARDPDVLVDVIARCVAQKARIVENDLNEDGSRRLLNLGHTLGHALEAHAGFAVGHGHCVARGLHFALDLARELRAIGANDAARCAALLAAYGHTAAALPPARELEPFLRRDKKVTADRVHFVLPTGIGRSEVRALPVQQVLQLLAR